MKSQWEFFAKTAKAGTLSHAYLLSGNDVRKKQETASKLIQLLYCENPIKDMPCGKCSSCQAVLKGLHPDFTKVFKDGSDIKIAQILRLNSFLSLTSSQGGIKTVMIEEADCMNGESQSAFLKLLEEPKGNTLFLLLTEHPYLLLPTIRSRTQEIPFFLLDPSLSKKQEHWVADLRKLQKENIASRFAYAKSLQESPEEYLEMLKAWTILLREILLQRVAQGKPLGSKLKTFLPMLEDTSHMLSTTNVNPSLALERLVLAL